MLPAFQPILTLARELHPADVPEFLASLEHIRIVALGVLMRPAAAAPDELLDITEASRRLNVSENYLYRNSAKFRFARRIGRKLLFSSAGLAEYLRKQR